MVLNRRSATLLHQKCVSKFRSIRAVDATGAGDTFGGAFVARIVAGDAIGQAGHYAGAAAALSTEGYGAVTPIPTSDQVYALLKNEGAT